MTPIPLLLLVLAGCRLDTDGDGSPDSEDCAIHDAAIHPLAEEICDGVDNDCDGAVDDDDVDVSTGATSFLDGDSDGYGDAAQTLQACATPEGYSDNADDCDDGNAAVHPDAAEVCDDGLDNDCSGASPECGLPPGTVRVADADYVFTGDAQEDFLGYAAALVDLNGDGTLEVVAASPGHDEVATDAGKVSVWYGPTTSGTAASTASLTLHGAAPGDNIGFTVGAAGDVDGDGTGDLLVGGYGYSDDYGGGFLVYGSSSALADSDISEHPTWVGDDRYDYLSYGLGGLGDLDGDGYDEFAFGAPYADDNGPSSGSVYVIYGAASALSGGSSDASFNGTGGYALLGFTGSIAGLGDVDGDGYDDAAFGENYAETANGGEVYVMHGSASAWSGNADVDVASDAVFSGGVAYASFGRTVVGADANDDGYADLLVHATLGEGEVGAVYLFYGGVSGFEGDYTTGHAEVTLTGRASFDYFGHTMASGDLDNDGTTDLVVGAHGDDTGADQAGATYVFAGPVTSGDSSTATVTVVGDAVNEAMGWGGTSVGDWSGDGIDDLLNATVSAGNHYGRISLFDGGSM